MAYYVFFDRELRGHVLENLNCTRICWDNEKLNNIINKDCDKKIYRESIAGCGTHFFWGIEGDGTRYPLFLSKNMQGSEELVGKNKKGELKKFIFNGESIIIHLKNKEIFPSVFTNMLVINFARNYICMGGYFQGDYLVRIKDVLLSACALEGKYSKFYNAINNIMVGYYISGPMFGLVKNSHEVAVPAGPIEIISRGGYPKNIIEIILNTTVKEAHMIGLYDMYCDVVTKEQRIEKWWYKLGSNLVNNSKTNVIK